MLSKNVFIYSLTNIENYSLFKFSSEIKIWNISIKFEFLLRGEKLVENHFKFIYFCSFQVWLDFSRKIKLVRITYYLCSRRNWTRVTVWEQMMLAGLLKMLSLVKKSSELTLPTYITFDTILVNILMKMSFLISFRIVILI